MESDIFFHQHMKSFFVKHVLDKIEVILGIFKSAIHVNDRKGHHERYEEKLVCEKLKDACSQPADKPCIYSDPSSFSYYGFLPDDHNECCYDMECAENICNENGNTFGVNRSVFDIYMDACFKQNKYNDLNYKRDDRKITPYRFDLVAYLGYGEPRGKACHQYNGQKIQFTEKLNYEIRKTVPIVYHHDGSDIQRYAYERADQKPYERKLRSKIESFLIKAHSRHDQR